MNYEKIKATVAEECKRLSLSEYEIYYKEGSDTSVETLNREVSAFSSSDFRGICLRVASGGKIGYASTELFEEAELKALVFRAAENAKAVEKEDVSGIYKGAKEYEKRESAHFSELDAGKIKKTAIDLANRAYKISDKVTEGTESSVGSSSFTVRISNSEGLDLENTAGINYVNISAVVADRGERESGYELALYNDDTDLDALAEKAIKTAEDKIGAVGVKSGKYNIVIDPRRMRQLLSAFISVFSAKSAQSGLSLLKGKEGERVASEIVTITDDPQREGVAVTTPFDAEGVPTYRKNVIEKGILKTLLYNRETAAKAGRESTGNGGKSGYSSPVITTPYAFCIEAGDKTADELLCMAGDGLLITTLNGLHAGTNASTGDFSLESAGFVIRDGKVCESAKSFTVAGNFFELLKSITALSNEVEVGVSGSYTTFGSPYVLIPDMSVAGS